VCQLGNIPLSNRKEAHNLATFSKKMVLIMLGDTLKQDASYIPSLQKLVKKA